mmetsp:Transcript_11597/g.8471  ORF Transcript_11597/g.8471 Transcript_11597/m.8471 type:complete len:138 (-) Transcript_11597:64-477(-)
MFLLCTETLTWKKFFVFEQPTARDQHSLTKLGPNRTYYLYGGNISPENMLSDELWRVSLSNVPFESKSAELAGATWEKLQYKGEAPGKLRGHRVVPDVDGENLLLFGGQRADFSCTNLLYRYHANNMNWELLKTKGH